MIRTLHGALSLVMLVFLLKITEVVILMIEGKIVQIRNNG